MNAPLFKEQAEKWLATGTNRKREPWREQTIATYRSQLANLLPVIGELPITEVGNKTLADVANALVEKGLEPSTARNKFATLARMKKGSAGIPSNGTTPSSTRLPSTARNKRLLA